MTAIVNTIWGGVVSQVVDRRLTGKTKEKKLVVVDPKSNKCAIVLSGDSLVTMAFTGVAQTSEMWFDCALVNALAHRQLDFASIQCGSALLARPLRPIVDELRSDLDDALNNSRDPTIRSADLRLSIVGWQLGRQPRPLSWELKRGPADARGMRFFELIRHPVARHFRRLPGPIAYEALGDVGEQGTGINKRLDELACREGLTHDDVERYVVESIVDRSKETATVGPDCIAIQLNPRDPDGQAQVTFYPTSQNAERQFLTPWVLTERLICAPTLVSSSMSERSACGRYVLGGFEDRITHLKVRTRLPVNFAAPDPAPCKATISMKPLSRERFIPVR